MNIIDVGDHRYLVKRSIKKIHINPDELENLKNFLNCDLVVEHKPTETLLFVILIPEPTYIDI